MFGSTNPFGQSSNNAFGSPSAFGQPSNTNSNPFGGQPFGGNNNTSSPFGSQQPGGNSMFGGTSTGVFGNSQPAFGASSSPGFGSSVTSFGASSTPAFGTSGSSVFGQQKPAFGGGFGTNTTQASPFGSSTFQQPQPAFGAAGNNNLFGSTTNQFGGSSQPAFGASTTPAFGATSTPAFGAASTPAFGTPSFGATSTPAFGSTTTSAFGSTGSAFGSGGAFGVSNTTPAFGTPGGTPAFGASSTPSFSFGSSPAFGQQSASTFGTTAFGATPSPFGAQSSSFGTQATTPTFGNSGFGQSGFGGQQRGGSRVAAYSPTAEVDSSTSQATSGKLESISAMPVYKEKSHEELRWEDYQLGDKGGPSPAAQSTAGGIGFGSTTNTQQSNPFATSSTFGQSSSNPFSSTTQSNPFGAKPSSPFGNTTTATFGSSPFGSSTTSNPFGSTTSAPTTTNSIFGPTTSAFGTTTSSAGFGQSPSIFGNTTAAGTTSGFSSGLGFGNTQSSPLFQSSTPSLGQTNSVFGQIGQSSPAFGQSNNIFSTPSTGFGGNMFSSTPSLISTSNSMGFGQTTPSFSTPFQTAQPAQTAGSFGFGNIGQTQSAGTSGFGGTPSGMFGQNTFGQSPATQSMAVAQPAPVTNPFGTLPAMPQMSIGRSGTAPTVQYGISSLPVVDKPAPVRISSLLTSRHLSQSRIRLPARRYHPKNDKVPFFNDDEETPIIPKADALFIPRENPRALVIRPLEQWPPRTNSDKKSPAKDVTAHENGEEVENGKQQPGTVNSNQKQNGLENNNSTKKNGNSSYEVVNGNRTGEAAAIVYEHGAGIEALLPKLRHPEYYTEPRMQELAAKERAEPGFCRHVKDFVIGRHGFGSIRFMGETDVRALDIESLVQFNNREVIVYMDETKKPPVGQGLNKPAEVTLLNIKCFDKKTGNQYTEGPKIDRYIAMLKKKAEDQDAKFVSYDPVKGEWKFMVSHFSKYCFGSEDEDRCDNSDC